MGWPFDDEAMKAVSLRWPSPRSLVAVTFLLLAVLLPPVVTGQPVALFTPVDEPPPPAPLADVTLRSRAVDIDFAQLQDVQTELAGSSSFNTLLAGVAAAPLTTGRSSNPLPNTTLHLNLFDDRVVTGIIDHTTPVFSGGYALTGRIVGDPLGTMALVINGETVSGTVRLSDGTYHIQSLGPGQYTISEEEETPLDCSASPAPEGGIEFSPLHEEPHPLERRNSELLQSLQELTSEESLASEQTEPEPHSVIDIAVFYTSELRTALGGTKEVKARIDLMVVESNRAYQNSGVNQNLNLVAAEEVNYTEMDNIDAELTRFDAPTDGHMDGIHATRERTRADISILLRARGGGTAYLNTNFEDPALLAENALYALAVSSAHTTTFAHEIGHVMGLEHDRYTAGCEDSTCLRGSYPYAYGYVNLQGLVPGAPDSARWKTIMAYNTLCRDVLGAFCPTVLFFSTPRRIFPDPGGDPLGVDSSSTATGRDGPADAARALNNARTQVANLQTGSRRSGRLGYLENPAQNSPQSGIGLVSGWACEATEVLVHFEFADGRVLSFPAAVGTVRTDTVGVCGHDETGFGLLWNWNILGDGVHTVRAFVDGVLLGAHEISVTTLGLGDFPRGLGGEYVVQDFPEMGKSTPLEWGQTRQNFVIAATRTVPANPGRIRNTSAGVMENPTAGSAHSGVAIISGWHCNAESVRIELVNGNTGEVISTQAGSGTERSDTAGVCGDSDNGFGLLWNWNILGDGWHTVRAFADEEAEPFSWSRVFVTTLGEEFARGLSGEYELADFPSAGQSVMVEWRQEQQNFVITGVE